VHVGTPRAERRLSLSQALERLSGLRTRFAITRVGETTRLHRIAIPTMCAVVPDSPDDVSIYNGRGLTRDEAYIGAVMEAVERQTAAFCSIPCRVAVPARVKTVDLQACGLREAFAHRRMPFVPARDLVTDEPLEVPKALVQMPWAGLPAFPMTHTNGLAAGFALDEAMYHALAELVERHLYAVTHARAHLRPKRLLRKILGTDDFPFVDDPVQEIVQPTGINAIDRLCRMFTREGLRLRLIAMCAPPLPIGVLAGVYDAERAEFRAGLGCSWSPVTAVIRAITEAAQARAADVQAARENILRADDPPSDFTLNTRRRISLPHGRWYFDAPTTPVRLDDFADESSGSLSGDLHALVQAVATVASHIAIVDLSPPGGTFFVVRAIVAELETLLIDGRVGSIARSIIAQAA
jgi:ribosomal protein S12 methylthiotransferase accessory factor